MLKVPCCRLSTVYICTDITLKHIQEKTINIFNDKMKNKLKPKRVNAFYAGEEIGDDDGISMFNIDNHSTITTYVLVTKNAVRTTIKKGWL